MEGKHRAEAVDETGPREVVENSDPLRMAKPAVAAAPTAVRGWSRRIVIGPERILRWAVAGPLEPKPIHPASERIGVKLQDGGGASGAIDHPAGPLERGQDMSTLDLLEAWQAVRS